MSNDCALPQPTFPAGRGIGRVVLLLIAYIALIVVGYVVFRSEGAMVRGNEMGRDRAMFTSVNAATLSGFQHSVATNEYLLPGQWMALALTMGGTLFALIAGGMAVTRIARLPYGDGPIVLASIALLVVAMFVGGTVLVTRDRTFFAGAFQAASALGNCGLYVGPLLGAADWRTHAALLPLAMIGSLGAPVLLELRDRIFRGRCLSAFSQISLISLAATYLIGLGLFAWLDDADFGTATLAKASVDAINSRSSGFAFEFAHALTRPAQWLYLAFMVVGGISGGTAGGIKLNTLVAVVRGTRRTLAGQAGGRAMAIGIVWIGSYVLLALFWLMLMLNAVPQMPADRLLFIVISAMSNVGASHDPVAIVAGGLSVLSLVMLTGRLLPLALLWWMAAKTHRAPPDDALPVG